MFQCKAERVSTNRYRFEPLVVAKTLLTRDDSGLKRDSTSVATMETGLFHLSWDENNFAITSPFGAHNFQRADLADVEADVLWESAFGICKHMEDDHADTFPEFLQQVGHQYDEKAEIFMPWVDHQGFFLTVCKEHVFIPFPKACETSNDVRKTLIKMLRDNDRSKN